MDPRTVRMTETVRTAPADASEDGTPSRLWPYDVYIQLIAAGWDRHNAMVLSSCY